MEVGPLLPPSGGRGARTQVRLGSKRPFSQRQDYLPSRFMLVCYLDLIIGSFPGRWAEDLGEPGGGGKS